MYNVCHRNRNLKISEALLKSQAHQLIHERWTVMSAELLSCVSEQESLKSVPAAAEVKGIVIPGGRQFNVEGLT